MNEKDIENISEQKISSDENNIVDSNAVEQIPNKSEKKKKNKKVKKIRTGPLKFIQHILLTAIIISICLIYTGSSIDVTEYNGNKTYFFSTTDDGREYEDSVLFNTMFGKNITGVLRYATIRTQFETNSVYDSRKVIDVTSFNYRSDKSVDSEIKTTAEYYLCDLLKWARYGFEYEEVPFNMLTDTQKKLVCSTYDMSDPDEYDDSDIPCSILKNRYYTVDGKTIEECVSDWDEYVYLTNQIQFAGEDLFSNYSEYLQLTDFYNQSNSNVRYCIVEGRGPRLQIYTNDDIDRSNVKDVDKIFKEYGKYVIYDTTTMKYSTNCAIKEDVFYGLLQNYEYAFSDDAKIYIAVDMNMPVEDSFAVGAKGYNSFTPYYKQLFLIIALSAIFYLFILIVNTINEGRTIDADGKMYVRTIPFDNLAIEWWLVFSIVVAVGTLFGYYFAGSERVLLKEYLYELNFIIIIGVCTFLYDVVVLYLYYSLVRRIKIKNIWKKSLLRRFCHWCKRVYYFIYDNCNVVCRTWVPFGGLLIVDAFLVTLINKHAKTGCALVLFIIINALAAYIIYIQVRDRQKIISGMKQIGNGELSYKAETEDMHGDNRDLAESVNSISSAVRKAVEQSTKDERMKTDLVANVSHDIRTPLTSIINYVDLAKRENIQNEKLVGYIQVIDEKSQRLKTLVEDLIEASKVSSGNVELNLVKMDFTELVNQSIAEFSDKFEEKKLTCVCSGANLTNPVIMADGKSLFRIMENLLGNVVKYAMPGSRVFIDMFNVNSNMTDYVVVQIKNMSSTPLPEDLSELTERFIRGDEARSTEGHGLGLSIAKSLTELMGGHFEIAAEADLFKVEVSFENVK